MGGDIQPTKQREKVQPLCTTDLFLARIRAMGPFAVSIANQLCHPSHFESNVKIFMVYFYRFYCFWGKLRDIYPHKQRNGRKECRNVLFQAFSRSCRSQRKELISLKKNELFLFEMSSKSKISEYPFTSYLWPHRQLSMSKLAKSGSS